MVNELNFLNLRISQKLPLIIVSAALILALGIGSLSYIRASQQAFQAIDEKLLAAVEARNAALSDYLGSIEQDIRFTATNDEVRQALVDFSAAWWDLGGNQTAYLQRLYIEDNPHPTGSKEELDAAADGSLYSTHHAKHHPWFRQFLRERGYYDIFLFDLQGNLIYTVFKELDYATNLDHGEWKDTDLGNAFRAARENPEPGRLNFFDFRPYQPSHGAPASFMSTAIHDADGQLMGVLVFQMPIDRINAVMAVNAGLGETGESYIVGGDSLMRSDSRFSDESTILSQAIDNDAIRGALAGETGIFAITGYRGMDMRAATSPLDFLGTRWAIVAEQALDEVEAPISAMRNEMLIIAVVLLFVVGAAGLFLSRGVTRPLSAMTAAMTELAGGNLGIEVPARSRSDEIGAMAQAVQVFKENAVKVEQMTAARVEEQKQTQETLKAEMRGLCDALDHEVQTTLHSVIGKTGEMRSTSDRMTEVAGSVTAQSSAAVATADTTTSKVQTVATAAEQLSSSIAEVGRQASQSTSITENAVNEAERTNQTVESLSQAADKIGAVVSLIADIAEQTNLLALNATIEAARAGEAGKGFAVVASEVKSLANQTAKATDEIGEQVSAMQGVTQEAVAAIRTITETIQQVSEIATTIATSVKEQDSATQEIAQNVQEAASGTQEVSANINQVSTASEESTQFAQAVRTAATDVADNLTSLQSSLTRILRESMAGNRRGAARKHDVNQATRIIVRGTPHDCTIKDISATGAEIDAVEGLAVGDTVELEIPAVGPVQGKILRVTEKSRAIAFVCDAITGEKIESVFQLPQMAA